MANTENTSSILSIDKLISSFSRPKTTLSGPSQHQHSHPRLSNIRGHPGRSGQLLERASGQPGAVQGTGLFWQPHRSVSVKKKDKSTTTDLHILPLKPNMIGSPSELHLTGSLGCIKSCLEKQKTWEARTLQLMCRCLAD